ncbi:integrase family protein [Algihabitans albus]|uniref:tyrosine-type recombinase/integrase n=1 Tax=Algihabitans albus TaxID=2164067 RepID=UPI0035D0D303
MPVIKITESFAQSAKQGAYWDTELKGFGLIVRPTGSKSLVVQKSGRKRYTLGTHPTMRIAEARDLARRRILEHDTNGAFGRIDDRITLRQAIELHAQDMREAGKVSQERMIEEAERHLQPWLDRQLGEITKRECRERHKKLSRLSGPYCANRVFRIIRAVYNKALKTLELPPNPTIGVEWNREYRRREPVADLRDWRERIDEIQNPVRRDWWLFVLSTGLRRTDALTVRWDEVNFDEGTIYRPKPKGGVDRAFTVPLSRQALEILQCRQMENPVMFGDDLGWAFPAWVNRDRRKVVSHLVSPRDRQVHVPSAHRLRDTYASTALDVDCPRIVTKILMNHTVPDSDVTEGYMRPSMETLSRWQQYINDQLWNKMDYN